MSWEIRQGDALELLRALPDEHARCCVTSPPYWGLRDYGVAGQIGLERTPEEYVARLVEVFREVRRVLAKDGTLWLNLGDSYWRNPKRGNQEKGGHAGLHAGRTAAEAMQFKHRHLPEKNQLGLPWRTALALQSDGWILRCDIVWAKPNPMPESVTDRPTKAHEYLFLLAKSEHYHYDAAAVAEDVARARGPWADKSEKQRGHSRRHAGFNGRYAEKIKAEGPPTKRNRRSVWTIATESFPEAHFATFPRALVEPCILAGSKPGDLVLDPFAGSGTVGVVALRHGRRFLGLELNDSYCEMARRRIGGPLFSGEATA